jgi:Icc-related predicted phosphoesterase
MRIVAISDTHGYHEELTIPDGDVLVCAGDISHGEGTMQQVRNFNDWFNRQPHKHKILVPGNHDFPFQDQAGAAAFAITKAHLLIDAEVVIEGIKFYGSPWQPWFHDWAFNAPKNGNLKDVWAKIPDDTDVLITHGPPKDILDRVDRGGYNVGCEDLAARVLEVVPRAHIFGHIHESHGQLDLYGIKFRNVSICTLRYDPSNPPTIIDI